MKKLVVFLSTLTLLSACDPTGGAESPFAIVVESEGVGPEGFDTATGWHVSLDSADVRLSAIYLWENPPALARSVRPFRLWDFVVAPAYAHAGDMHFAGGAVLGEHVGLVSVDLLNTPLDLGEHIGNEGRVRSFSVVFEPSKDLDGHVAWVSGQATKNGVTIPFEGGLSLAAGRERRVDGLVTDGWIAKDATFVLTVELARWFRDAEFSTLAADGVISPDAQVRAAWFLGARSNQSFSGSWRTTTE